MHIQALRTTSNRMQIIEKKVQKNLQVLKTIYNFAVERDVYCIVNLQTNNSLCYMEYDKMKSFNKYNMSNFKTK